MYLCTGKTPVSWHNGWNLHQKFLRYWAIAALNSNINWHDEYPNFCLSPKVGNIRPMSFLTMVTINSGNLDNDDQVAMSWLLETTQPDHMIHTMTDRSCGVGTGNGFQSEYFKFNIKRLRSDLCSWPEQANWQCCYRCQHHPFYKFYKLSHMKHTILIKMSLQVNYFTRIGFGKVETFFLKRKCSWSIIVFCCQKECFKWNYHGKYKSRHKYLNRLLNLADLPIQMIVTWERKFFAFW